MFLVGGLAASGRAALIGGVLLLFIEGAAHMLGRMTDPNAHVCIVCLAMSGVGGWA